MIRTKSNIRRLLVRIIAGLLVLSMIPGLVMFSQTGISMGASGDENRSVRIAAQQLLQRDPYAKRSRIRRMSDFARNLLKTKRSAEDYELAIDIAIAQGKYDEALAFQEKELEAFEGGEEELAAQYLRMGYLYAVMGEYEKALNWLNLGAAVTPYVEAVLTRAQVRLNLGDIEGALRDADACLATVGESSELLPDLVNIYEAAGAYETAVRLWTRVLDDGGKSDYLLDRAYCYVELGRMEEAEADIARYLNLSSAKQSTAEAMLGIGFLRAGDYRRAGESFVRAVSSESGENTSLYFYVVLCSYLSGDYSQACQYGEKLIEIVRNGGSAETAELAMENTTGRIEVKLTALDFRHLCQMTGAAYMMERNFTRATEVLTMSLETEENPYVRFLRGSSLMAEEKWQEALTDFDIAAEAGTETEKCRFSIGVCHMEMGNIPEALAQFAWVTENGRDEGLREEAAQLSVELTAEQTSKQ